MALLIDGYNLIYGAGIVGRGFGPGGLERSRMALLNSLASALSDAECRITTVVFDASQAPPGLPDRLQHRGIEIRFARDYASADELLEELIQADTSPRRLTVVSSDHRVQRAAKRRRAIAVDADVWFGQLLSQLPHPREEQSSSKPSQPHVSASEVEYWLREFGGEVSEAAPDKEPSDSDRIFPPGYGEDVEEK
ncbi:MAG: NYN domain-containing protein [Planctomycetes bacterium]|nr:NYN domain-containing protein [Planctomycetota bacterium]